MRVLVAGGSGFIGSHVCEELLRAGHEVYCLDNFTTGRSANTRHLVGRPGFRLIEQDVEQAPDMAVDLVLHLASPASPIHYALHPIDTMSANSAGTRRLLEIAESNGARFLYASTSEIYGDPEVHPQVESYWGNVSSVGPRACYDEGKRFGEAMTMSFRRERRVNVGIIRIFNTYGPRMDRDDGRVVPAFVCSALRGERLHVHGEGSQTRSFCYVADLVQGLLQVAFDRDADGEIFNVGNPHEVTMLELAEAVMRTVGNQTGVIFEPRPVDDPGRRCPDISKIHARYGWQPTIDLEEGLRRTVAFFAGQTVEQQIEVA